MNGQEICITNIKGIYLETVREIGRLMDDITEYATGYAEENT